MSLILCVVVGRCYATALPLPAQGSIASRRQGHLRRPGRSPRTRSRAGSNPAVPPRRGLPSPSGLCLVSAYGTDSDDCITEDFWPVVTEGNEDQKSFFIAESGPGYPAQDAQAVFGRREDPDCVVGSAWEDSIGAVPPGRDRQSVVGRKVPRSWQETLSGVPPARRPRARSRTCAVRCATSRRRLANRFGTGCSRRLGERRMSARSWRSSGGLNAPICRSGAPWTSAFRRPHSIGGTTATVPSVKPVLKTVPVVPAGCGYRTISAASSSVWPLSPRELDSNVHRSILSRKLRSTACSAHDLQPGLRRHQGARVQGQHGGEPTLETDFT